jgi:hypothetical protein
VERVYEVTKNPAFCPFKPISLLPAVSYLTFDSTKIYVDPSKITLLDLDLLLSFTLKVDSATASDTTAGEQTVRIFVDYVIDCKALKLDISKSMIKPVIHTIMLSEPD